MDSDKFSKDELFLLSKIGIVLKNNEAIDVFSQRKRPKLLLTIHPTSLARISIRISKNRTNYNFWEILTILNQNLFSTDSVDSSAYYDLIFKLRTGKSFMTQISDFDVIRTERILARINEQLNADSD